jgi:hypothetical protein
MKKEPDSPEIEMLRSELEMLMRERQALLAVAGAAAIFVDKINLGKLPLSAIDPAATLAKNINQLSEATLKEALESQV